MRTVSQVRLCAICRCRESQVTSAYREDFSCCFCGVRTHNQPICTVATVAQRLLPSNSVVPRHSFPSNRVPPPSYLPSRLGMAVPRDGTTSVCGRLLVAVLMVCRPQVSPRCTSGSIPLNKETRVILTAEMLEWNCLAGKPLTGGKQGGDQCWPPPTQLSKNFEEN